MYTFFLVIWLIGFIAFLSWELYEFYEDNKGFGKYVAIYTGADVVKRLVLLLFWPLTGFCTFVQLAVEDSANREYNRAMDRYNGIGEDDDEDNGEG